jgi:hypothetical protein
MKISNLNQTTMPDEKRKPKPKQKLILTCCQARLYKGEKCSCESIAIIQRTWRDHHHKLSGLPVVKVGKEKLSYQSIDAFLRTAKNQNDSNNKQREAIVDALVNQNIPDDYFRASRRWNSLRGAVNAFVEEVFPEREHQITCLQKGGRKFNYDFEFVCGEKSAHIELKFNAADVDETPQFASPMKPSQYLSQGFEEHHYNTVLPRIAEVAKERLGGLPDKEAYFKEIHGNKPACMSQYQTLYYQGCKGSSKFTEDPVAIKFYETALSESKQGIYDFIETTELDADKLTEYLLETQKGKVYMLYSKGRFIKQEVNLDDYIITSVTKNAKKSRYECETKTGIKLNVLLRWKNGNGIAFPAFQISAHR